MKSLLSFLLFFPIVFSLKSQEIDVKIKQAEATLQALRQEEKKLLAEIEDYKLEKVRIDIKAIGLPSQNYIEHSAMFLEYDEAHEQAKWVAHMILPDIATGAVHRTNDFREDPLVKTGSAVEADYFLKFLQPDSTYTYDGFGYDRGHLAPSADFNWSEKALSESYFYSNMSPQLGDFNRGKWADLEVTIRNYVLQNPNTALYVVTGPILEKDLPVIERSINKVSIPRWYFKVVIDPKNKQGIGVIMPNQAIEYPIAYYAVSIDSVEKVTGLDFFSGLADVDENPLEAKIEKEAWFPEMAKGDVAVLAATAMPKNHFNTVQAARYADKNEKINVCGTVVSTRYSRSGNLWLNLDKKFPDQIFSVFIRKEHLPNFTNQPEQTLLNQQTCFTGTVEMLNGTPTMSLTKEEQIKPYTPNR
ncbi:MAG TPA: DNA/RNA non-specific endonuclease [Saprospiraceae bacterium]|nr:DNA/RNA non-specific endonuclease [Saprospiraceae bacterium]HMQ82734.1 DNA/RNA non-specific endonuclease [Saprospiraceae bacterium]